MKTNLASILGFLVLAALMSGVSVPASADNYITIALGRACGPDRYGHPLHLQFSKNESLCVYLTNNTPFTNSPANSCPTVLAPADMTAMPDARNNACKQIAGTAQLGCAGGAVFFVDRAPASSVVGVLGFAVATADGGGGQVCLEAIGPFSGTSSYPGPCGIPNTTALYSSLTTAAVGQGVTITPGVEQIPGFGHGVVNGLGTFACVTASTPVIVDVPDPSIGKFIPPQ